MDTSIATLGSGSATLGSGSATWGQASPGGADTGGCPEEAVLGDLREIKARLAAIEGRRISR